VIVENLGDAPFAAERVEAATIAAMTRIALAIRRALPDLALGVNVLRNDALAALGIATATDAAFVRVNVHTGVMVTDQGVITGRARETLLERNRLGAGVAVAADVHVKHAAPLGDLPLADAARDTWHRGAADALIVTGRGTGLATDLADVAMVRAAVPEATVWIGSGLDPERAREARDLVHGAIVGTWLHTGERLDAPLELDRVRAMRAALGAP
jgi:hypothetical protein